MVCSAAIMGCSVPTPSPSSARPWCSNSIATPATLQQHCSNTCNMHCREGGGGGGGGGLMKGQVISSCSSGHSRDGMLIFDHANYGATASIAPLLLCGFCSIRLHCTTSPVWVL